MLQIKIALACISAAILFASLVSGCATSAETGALMGSSAGCLIAIQIEKDPKKRTAACIVVGAAAGAAGFYIGRQQDLVLARAAAQQIQASQPGVVAVQMRTQSLAVPLESRSQINNVSTIESLDTMVISVPVSQIQRMDPKAANTLSMVGKFVSDANTNSRVIVSASNLQDYEYMVNKMKSGYSRPLSLQKVAYQYQPLTRGTQASVEVSPVPATAA